MWELRIVRLIVTVGFLIMVTLVATSFAGAWGYVLGAVMFGALTVFLWKEQVVAETEERYLPPQRSSAVEHDAPPHSDTTWS